MDKKNTMLLTVIAVATLLVAVVGATFAYFTATATDSSTNTVVTATTENVATVTLTNPTPTLSLTLTTADMAQDEDVYQPYWATNTDANYDTSATQRQIAVATVGTGGSSTAKYTCTVTLNVTVTGTMASELVTNDAYIQFGGLKTDKVDLASIVADGGSYPITFNLTGTNTTANVTAAVAIENRNADQTDLAGKTLTVTFADANDFKCTVVA